jgi:hypothetical protein
MPHRRIAMMTALVMVVAAGCNDESVTGPTAPPPDDGEVTTTTAATTTGATTSTTTTTTTSTSTTTPQPERTFGVLPDNIGAKVDNAPGVTTPGDIRELLPNAWVFIPSEPDPNDTHVQPPLPEDIDIITAYIEERTAILELVTQNPLPTEPSARYAAISVDGAVDIGETLLKPRSAAGQYYDLREGILLRPVVIDDPRSDTEAIIFDCQLDASAWVNADGTLADGRAPGVQQYPQIARMKKVDGRWLADTVTSDDRVCA